jgi:hypothetical protein
LERCELNTGKDKDFLIGFEVLLAVGTKTAVYQRFDVFTASIIRTVIMEAVRSSETLVNSYQST